VNNLNIITLYKLRNKQSCELHCHARHVEHVKPVELDVPVTGQLADIPTRLKSSRGLVNLQTSHFAEMFY